MDRPIVTISEGKIQGTILKSVLGTNYLAFRGIPYAKPPIGPLRFKKPEPPSKWPGIRDCSKYGGDIPLQKEFVGQGPYGVMGSEDCLYLNVYTKSIGHKRPVMFLIYGGGFHEGDANRLYQEDYLVDSDAILVWTNYRIGPMGFMNLGHEIASGNQGLRDLIFALKWIQRNIEAFGGDPNNVTIFGNSAGAYIAHLFTLIPATKGLFHKAILQSGSSFKIQNLIKGTGGVNGFEIASHLGMKSDDPIEVFEFLSKVPAEKLIELDGTMLSLKEVVLEAMMYEPVYDAPFTDDPIVPQTLNKLIKADADIPMIIGHTLNESLLDLMGKFDDADTLEAYAENIEEYIINSLHLKDSKLPAEIMRDLRKKYLKNKPINRENVWNLVNLMSDLYVLQDRKTIDIRNNHARAPTYVYCFSYMGNEPTVFQFDRGPQPLKGVAHADELAYMLYTPYMREGIEGATRPMEDPKDKLVMERIKRMWYNFAATGNPTPKTDDVYITTTWKPSSKDKLYYLDINDELTLKDDRDTDGWKLYEQYKNYMSF